MIRAQYASHVITLAVTGMGTANADAAIRTLLDEFKPDTVLSMGFGGALAPMLRVGDVVVGERASLVSEHGLEKSLRIPDGRAVVDDITTALRVSSGHILTMAKPMKKNELRRFAGEGEAAVCDMETFPLAARAGEKGIRFVAARVVTDGPNEEIPPEFFNVVGNSGEYRLAYAARLFARKPSLIPAAARLALRSRRASRNLRHFFDALVRVL